MLPARRFNGQLGLTDFFNDFFENKSLDKIGTTVPAINVMENDKEYKIEVAAPGMCKDDFKVHLNKDGNLVIEMEKTNCGCKGKNEDKKDEKEVKKVEEEVKEDVENCGKKGKVDNSKTDYFSKLNEIYNSASSSIKEEPVYVSRADREQAADDYFRN